MNLLACIALLLTLAALALQSLRLRVSRQEIKEWKILVQQMSELLKASRQKVERAESICRFAETKTGRLR